MFFPSKPDAESIARILDSCQPHALAYPNVGATLLSNIQVPKGYRFTEHTCQLGNGDHVFQQACDNLRKWKIFDLPWLTFYHQAPEIEKDTTVGILIRNFGIWSFNPCKIIDIIDGQAETRQFGFSYGTLPQHAVNGEERFLIEQDNDGNVSLGIVAFSRPRHILAYLGYPVLRYQQSRFAPQASAQFRASLQLTSTS